MAAKNVFPSPHPTLLVFVFVCFIFPANSIDEEKMHMTREATGYVMMFWSVYARGKLIRI